MKNVSKIVLLLLALAILASGLVPTQETVDGGSCGWDLAARDMACQPVTYTWMNNGWLVQLLTGCKRGLDRAECLRR